jgi:hypothetical protein
MNTSVATLNGSKGDELTNRGVDKIAMWGWSTKDRPGHLMMVPKSDLRVHADYQRSPMLTKVGELASSWSWIACGVLIVGRRGGELWVIDGQHRLLAARKRSDIKELPCIVFDTVDVSQEAGGFLDANTNRKPVPVADRFGAMVAHGDETPVFVSETFDDIGLTVKRVAKNPGEIKCIGWALRCAAIDRDRFVKVLRMGKSILTESAMVERILAGLWHIETKAPGTLDDKRFHDRIKAIGVNKLLDGIARANAYYQSGGEKVWATGILNEMNHGLRNKFSIDAETEVAQ